MVTPSVKVTVTPAYATGAESVATSNVAAGAVGLALRVASFRWAESVTNSITSRVARPAPSQLRRTLSPTASIVSASPPPPVPPPTTIFFDATRAGSG